MNKQELVAAIAAATDLSKSKAEQALNAITETVTSELAAGNEVVLVNFGTFGVRARAARPGRNPQTGAVIALAAKTVPAFRPGKALKDAVN
ncbi:DNA-binding protein HU-beta [compost metagenome]